MYGICGFVEKLNIQSYENLTENYVHYIYVRNVWICRKIEYPKLQEFNGKFCTLYMYRMFGFAKKLNIQNCENSMGNCLHYICTKSLDLQKN